MHVNRICTNRIKKIKALTTKACQQIGKNESYDRRVAFSQDISNITHDTK